MRARVIGSSHNGPQCEGIVGRVMPSYRKKMGSRCRRGSEYEIDGKVYCFHHAGKLALQQIIGSQELMPINDVIVPHTTGRG